MEREKGVFTLALPIPMTGRLAHVGSWLFSLLSSHNKNNKDDVTPLLDTIGRLRTKRETSCLIIAVNQSSCLSLLPAFYVRYRLTNFGHFHFYLLSHTQRHGKYEKSRFCTTVLPPVLLLLSSLYVDVGDKKNGESKQNFISSEIRKVVTIASRSSNYRASFGTPY